MDLAIRMLRDFVRRTGGINGGVAKKKNLRGKKMREASIEVSTPRNRADA